MVIATYIVFGFAWFLTVLSTLSFLLNLRSDAPIRWDAVALTVIWWIAVGITHWIVTT